MIKKLGFAAILSALLLSGCGGGGSSSESAESILKGKTFYYTDNELNEANGYYKEVYSTKSFIETEYLEDGTLVSNETILFTYSGNKITIDDEGYKFDCTVTKNGKSIVFDCLIPGENFKHVSWTTIKDAKANPE
jgi:major membrane immunogen (membrane-anchored lipoprotein)